MQNDIHPRPIAPREWQPILGRLESTLNALSELKRQLGLLEAAPGAMPGLAQAMHVAFVNYSLSTLSRFSKVILRPIGKNLIWVDMPTGRSFSVADTMERADPRNWQRAFPDFKEDIVNLIGNEDYMVVERHSTGTHQGPLQIGDQVIKPTGRRFDIQVADVVKIENGEAVHVEHYYDMVSVLRRLGLMPDIPLGHDERTATIPTVLHASGFLKRTPAVRVIGKWPSRLGQSISIGSSKTDMAQRNMRNCQAIHEAFIEHTPERFQDLIAENAVWIDVPTGEILNGAVAAAHHDHGNWQTAFPDSSAEVTKLIPNDDWVVVQHRGYGSHLGQLSLGGKIYEPTGRKIEIRVLDIVQYRDGKAVLIRNYYDMAMMLIQLGVMPG